MVSRSDFFVASEGSKAVKRRLGYSVNINALNNASASAENVIQELNYYIANRNLDHITNAFNQMEQGFQVSMAYAIPAMGNASADASEGFIDSLKVSFDTALSGLKGDANELAGQLNALEVKAQDNINSVDRVRADIERSQAELVSITAEFKATYQELESAWEADFAKKIEKWSIENNTALQNISERTSELIERISQKEAEARKLVQSVGGKLLTASYSSHAANEYRLSEKFRLITVSLFGIGILIVLSNCLIHVIAQFNEQVFDENPWTIAARLLTAVTVALPAFYTARESARHRTNGDRATQRELELSTLDPFIELMPDDVKTAIRDRLTDRYFGNPVEPHNVTAPLDTETITKLANAFKPMPKFDQSGFA
jgi:hypothetical protein